MAADLTEALNFARSYPTAAAEECGPPERRFPLGGGRLRLVAFGFGSHHNQYRETSMVMEQVLMTSCKVLPTKGAGSVAAHQPMEHWLNFLQNLCVIMYCMTF